MLPLFVMMAEEGGMNGMNASIYRISLDVHKVGSQEMLSVKQRDTARRILISLTDGGTPYEISGDCKVRFRAKKADGKIIYNDCRVLKNVIEYVPTSATTDTVGVVECEVTLYGADDRQLTSPRFSLIVDESVASDKEIEGTNEFTALAKCFEWADNMDLSVEKVGRAATIRATTKDGVKQSATVYDGKPAYEYAVENGYTGTEDDFGKKMAFDVEGALRLKADRTEVSANTEAITSLSERVEVESEGIRSEMEEKGRAIVKLLDQCAYSPRKITEAPITKNGMFVVNSTEVLSKGSAMYVINEEIVSVGYYECQYGSEGNVDNIYSLNDTTYWSAGTQLLIHVIGMGTATRVYVYFLDESNNIFADYFVLYVDKKTKMWSSRRFQPADLSSVLTKTNLTTYEPAKDYHPATKKYVDKASNNKVDKRDAEITGSLSMGRKENTTPGTNSTALGVDVTAAGTGSHAEGNSTKANGNYSHTEGGYTKAEGSAGHAEGYYTEATGPYSHAAGNSTKATGDQSHAEGHKSVASGNSSHAEGYRTVATGNYSHAEGESYNCNEDTFNTTADMITAWGTDKTTKFARAAGQASHVEGRNCLAIASCTHAEGHVNIARGSASHAEGEETQSIGVYSHSEGKRTKARGNSSHAEGGNTEAIGDVSHSEGEYTKASGRISHVEGHHSITGTWADASHAEGIYTMANGVASHTEGNYTTANGIFQHTQGKFNAIDAENKYAHIVGNGTSDDDRSNAHTLDWQGNAWYQGSMTSNGADYAEFFEWLDGNPDQEDRVGLLVTLDGEKVKLANTGDEVLGIVSGTAAVLGDNYECAWNGKYVTDDFGRILYDEVEEFVEVPNTIFSETENEETGEIEIVETTEIEMRSLGFFKHPRINPDYDPEQAYVNRADRPEWDMVGMLGKLYLCDDGTCEVNKYATVGTDGVATASDEKTSMRVLSRVSENVVRVLLK